jgi:tetratricopeptide (TPR) repeat protein
LHIYEHNSHQSSSNIAATHALFLNALFNLANFYDSDRRFSKSEKEWRRFVQLTESSSDKFGDMLITGYDRLANCLIEQHKNDDAQAVLRKALQFQNDKIKDGIKSSTAIYQQASFLTKLANILKEAHHFDEAELHYKQALDGLIKVLGATHKDLAPTMEGYADLLALTYREAEAEHMRACTRSLIEKK